MTITINGKELELYIGENDGNWVDTEDGKKEWVVTEDKELNKFIEAIGDMKGVLFTNYRFSDDSTHYHGGDTPSYRINGYREEPSDWELENWTREEIEKWRKTEDRTLEQVKKELLKHDDVQAIFIEDGYGECTREIYYAGEDGHFFLSDEDDIFGWA